MEQQEATRMKTEETTSTAMDAATPAGRPKKSRGTKRTAKPASKKASKSARSKKRSVKTQTKSATKKAARSVEECAGTKQNIVLELLRRKDGATTAEIAKATGWQKHSIRGFISGNVTHKMGLAVESSKNEEGERTNRIAQ
jgi:hypothetical protein